MAAIAGASSDWASTTVNSGCSVITKSYLEFLPGWEADRWVNSALTSGCGLGMASRSLSIRLGNAVKADLMHTTIRRWEMVFEFAPAFGALLCYPAFLPEHRLPHSPAKLESWRVSLHPAGYSFGNGTPVT
jgi:hypothetical protein